MVASLEGGEEPGLPTLCFGYETVIVSIQTPKNFRLGLLATDFIFYIGMTGLKIFL